ncbi:rhodanese-like domain-containing protein [Bacillus sp. 165]|uniref:rhodanese-like domain-containing protein n=1 Tax=Bacillus sp. 165 TaxID=1529117 RepID=UPI001ADA9D33|nr:rhodanese-like domain-containing protein [Bacillus sp. 165]MBO9130227.1 rhodanese-like domain-containing protein [Bacillus sp. 165]
MKECTAKEIEARLHEKGELSIIDVREAAEVATGKIPHAINIPLGLLEFRMHELEKSKEYVVVCQSGGRSFRAAELLERYGYNVANMSGGMLAWTGKIE